MMRFRVLALAASSLLSPAPVPATAETMPASPPATSADSGDWPAYAHDLRSTKYSPLALVDKESFQRLRVAWRWSSPDNAIVQNNPSLHLNLFEGTPLMVDGELYVSTGLNQVAAIDAASGRTRWVFDPGVYKLGVPKRLGFVHRGVATWGSRGGRRIFLATGDAYLIALDAATGKAVEGFGERGRVDLTKGLRRPVDRFVYGVNSPPLVIGDVVVVGSFVSDGWLMREGAPGDVRAFDARSGKLLWTFHTVPQAGEAGLDTWLDESWRRAGSTNVWTWMSADDQLGYVFLPVSTPTNDHYGGDRPGDNLFAESIVCLEARTGRRVWHFQVAHHGLWDYDLPAAPVLADLTVDGRRVPALAQVTKQAFVFVLDRRTGAPIWPIEERPVPSSRVPGERAAPTQPFPTRPAPFDRQGLGADDLLDFTPALRAEAEALVANVDHGPLYTPPSERGTIQLPGTVGGASWAGAALDPETGTLFVPSVTIPNTVTIARPESPASDMRYVTRPLRPRTQGPRDLPLIKPPYGRITAIDLNTGEHRWMAAHGTGPRDHPALEGLKLPPLGWDSRGFVVATKTLLLAVQEPRVTARLPERGAAFEYTAETREARLRAFDKGTGGLLGEIELPANAGGSPMTYRVGNRQFIVIPIGGGGVPPELVALAVVPPSKNVR